MVDGKSHITPCPGKSDRRRELMTTLFLTVRPKLVIRCGHVRTPTLDTNVALGDFGGMSADKHVVQGFSAPPLMLRGLPLRDHISKTASSDWSISVIFRQLRQTTRAIAAAPPFLVIEGWTIDGELLRCFLHLRLHLFHEIAHSGDMRRGGALRSRSQSAHSFAPSIRLFWLMINMGISCQLRRCKLDRCGCGKAASILVLTDCACGS